MKQATLYLNTTMRLFQSYLNVVIIRRTGLSDFLLTYPAFITSQLNCLNLTSRNMRHCTRLSLFKVEFLPFYLYQYSISILAGSVIALCLRRIGSSSGIFIWESFAEAITTKDSGFFSFKNLPIYLTLSSWFLRIEVEAIIKNSVGNLLNLNF